VFINFIDDLDREAAEGALVWLPFGCKTEKFTGDYIKLTVQKRRQVIANSAFDYLTTSSFSVRSIISDLNTYNVTFDSDLDKHSSLSSIPPYDSTVMNHEERGSTSQANRG